MGILTTRVNSDGCMGGKPWGIGSYGGRGLGVMLGYVMLCYAMLCYVMLGYVMLC